MLAQHFEKFRQNTIGHDFALQTTDKALNILYADWTASGRLYQPIENFISETLGPYIANTHTETNLTGSTMTLAYHEAQGIIKRHVNANDNDALICAGSGMTTVINKLQRMMGLRVPKQLAKSTSDPTRPVVFVTHMEHHSNQTTWNTCDVDVEVVRRGDNGQPCQQHLHALLKQHQHRALKIGSFTACSNVTGICTDYHQLAKIMHQYGGLCFVDFACSAPYVSIDMHPTDPLQKLDAIFFSPHKFLGGPGSCGVLIFDRSLYATEVPDQPGGGTVTWTNPWGQQGFYNDIEVREDGGTPGFLQTIRAALAIQVKEAMGIDKMARREKQLTDILMSGLNAIDDIYLLEPDVHERLCVVSFYSTRCHYNLMVRLLNDKFGIQARGGCSCAGTYGHILLNVDKAHSESITGKIDQGDLSDKPGWVRVSLHPTNTDEEAQFIVRAVEAVMRNLDHWQQQYVFNRATGEFINVMPTSVQKSVLSHFDPLQLHSALFQTNANTENNLQRPVVTL
ncbi:aminotransferase class V-fold PLP-dependent enzyme [Alteromonas flava]|uniref:aminotransferase class V-fold PLP-dependent enzyme n=1 Tax=Alteromonas flava TaxID=2048003 RepID=UPI000C286DB3|nr:aminotransferase class V-fold PLP-dependent enzyme [Alteromonas flava]